MVDTEDNIDSNFLASLNARNLDPVKALCKILGSCLEEQLQHQSPELPSKFQDILREQTHVVVQSASVSRGNRPAKDVAETKREFEELQAQLFNDLKQLGNIRVYYRIRPTFNAEAKGVIDFIGEDGSLVVVDPSKRDERKVFQFNRVYGPTATQDEVFKDSQPLIRSVKDGYNVCILAYGQTGSGKTYTMCGPSGGLAKDMGINYFALNDLFQLSNQRKDIISYDIYAQMVERYNEQVRDLLAEESSSTKYPFSWLEIRSHHTNDGSSLPDVALHSVKFIVHVLNLMKQGDENRAVNFTAMNNQSSRSHSVLTVHVHGEDTSGNILHSRLYTVDLARSEQVDKLEVTGDLLKETQHINKSLSCLGDVFTALSQKSSYFPYRNNRLTLLLPDALGGHAKTLMFAPVSPEGDDFGEILGTLKFAQRVSSIELGAACLNKQSSEFIVYSSEDLDFMQIENLEKELIELPEDVCKFSPLGSVTPHQYQELQEGQEPSKDRSTYGGRNMISDPKSPNETNARALRRQSLTGIPSAGSDRLHISSLENGGKSNVVPIMKLTKET
ncbi:Kinesin-like protein KIN-14L [Ancistrocladus abbreviatus]